MGSLEEEELAQMIHDFIESDPSSPISYSSSNCFSLNSHGKLYSLQEILRRETDTEAEVLARVLKHLRCKRDAEKATTLKKWLVTRLRTDGFDAPLCQTSWVTSLGCPAGDYEYIEVMTKDEQGLTLRLIVDIDFKSQFELARPTQSYKDLANALPDIFVGDEEKLNKIISILCSAAKQSLKERGLHVPPWRTATYMQSKWRSGRQKLPEYDFDQRESREREGGGRDGGNGLSMTSKQWPPPPLVGRKRRAFHGGGGRSSGLSNQFSNMSINCC